MLWRCRRFATASTTTVPLRLAAGVNHHRNFSTICGGTNNTTSNRTIVRGCSAETNFLFFKVRPRYDDDISKRRYFRETTRRRLSHSPTNKVLERASAAKEGNFPGILRQPTTTSSNFVLWDSLSQSMKEVPVVTTNRDNTTTKALAWYTCGPTTYSAMHLGHARTYVWLDMMRRVLEFVAAAQGAPPPLFVMNITDIDDKILAAAAVSSSSSLETDNTTTSSSSAHKKGSADSNRSAAATTTTSKAYSHQSPMAISRRAEANFWKDMDRLGCQRPHITTRVTEFVDSDIVPYIERLVKKGMAYQAHDGVYFDVHAFESKVGSYGKLAGAALKPSSSPPSSTITTVNDDSPSSFSSTSSTSSHSSAHLLDKDTSEKRDKRDFALWKLRKQGEDVYWSSPWGDGRPGWHIECSAMIEAVQRQFQDTHEFRVHAGGVDLKFPHHTNEIAQAEAFHHNNGATNTDGDTSTTAGACHCSGHNGISSSHNGEEWIPHWVHTGHLMVKQEKMSKSLKNFLTVDELWFDNDPSTSSSQLDSPADDFRLWCLMGASYGHREEYSRSRMLGARQSREKMLRFLLDGERWIGQCCDQAQNYDTATTTNDSDSFTCTDDDYDDKKTKRWSDQDRAFFVTVNEASTDSYRALLNNMSGTKYVSGLLRIAEAGSAHIRQQNPRDDGAIVEPVKTALQSMRNLLGLVGFSARTVRAGLQEKSCTTTSSSSSDTTEDTPTTKSSAAASSYLVGGEAAIIEELVRFRAAVRMAALEDVKSKLGTDKMKTILKACDELRDSLPKIGVEVMDRKMDQDPTWRYCVPTKDKIS